jgi:hypothetical protein
VTQRQALDASYRSEHPPRRRDDIEQIDQDVVDAGDVDVSDRRELTPCPFDGNLTCPNGCMMCGDGAKCCNVGDSCAVPVTAETPCPYSSTMATCMMCNNAKGEPTLVSANPGDTCSSTTFCSAYSGVPPPKPAAGPLSAARGHPMAAASSLQMQQAHLLQLQKQGNVGVSGSAAMAAAHGMSFTIGSFGGAGSAGGGGDGLSFHRSPVTLSYGPPLAMAAKAKAAAPRRRYAHC